MSSEINLPNNILEKYSKNDLPELLQEPPGLWIASRLHVGGAFFWNHFLLLFVRVCIPARNAWDASVSNKLAIILFILTLQ